MRKYVEVQYVCRQAILHWTRTWMILMWFWQAVDIALLIIILPPSPPAAGSRCDGDGRGEEEDDGDEKPEDEAADHVAGWRRSAVLARRGRLRSLCNWSVEKENRQSGPIRNSGSSNVITRLGEPRAKFAKHIHCMTYARLGCFVLFSF